MNRDSDTAALMRHGWMFLAALVVVFVFEVAIMLVFSALPFHMPYWVEALVDATLLVALLGPLLYFLFFRSIAASNRALRESEERFRLLAENARDMIYIMSLPEGRYEYVSPASTALFGYSPEEFYHSPHLIRQVIHPDWRDYFGKAWTNLVNGIAPPTYEYQIVHKSGETRWLNQRNVLLRDASGALVAIEGIVTDVTEHKQAEAALCESEERFRAMFEHAPRAVVMVDEGGAIALANAQAEQMFGYGREELLGRSVDTLVPERLRTEHARLCAAFAGAPEARAMGRGRYLFARRKDGSELPVEIGLSPVRTGGRSYVLVSVVDITDLRRAQHATEEALRAKTDFMKNLTHELRTPLNSVIGFAELLKDGVPGPLNAKQARFVADIHESGLRLLKLVQGILDMSRFDAAGVELEREAVDIGAVLQERVAAQRKAAEARGIALELDVAADAGSAELDPKALRRMLDALLDNAIKFNREGGIVAVSARRAGGAFEIAIADTGIGIARADLPKLFQPLAQLDAGLARQHGGVGLGLALARRLVELHGGTIEVESEPGHGSTFTVGLPCRQMDLAAFG